MNRERCRNCGHIEGRNVMICERRDADGKLDFTGEQPTDIYWTEEEIARYYYRHNPTGPNVDMTTMYLWFKETKGWTFRAKTW